MSSHPTITVSAGKWTEQIDVELAPLIEAIWKAGIVTTCSCQENRPGIAWIGFLTAIDASDFLDAVAGEFSEETTSLYCRIRQEWLDGTEAGLWEFSTHPWDVSVRQRDVGDGEIEESSTGPAKFVFPVSIRFPKTDIPLLIERMKAFNESKRGAEYRQERGVI